MRQLIAVILILALIGSSIAADARKLKRETRSLSDLKSANLRTAMDRVREKFERTRTLPNLSPEKKMEMREKFAEEVRQARMPSERMNKYRERMADTYSKFTQGQAMKKRQRTKF